MSHFHFSVPLTSKCMYIYVIGIWTSNCEREFVYVRVHECVCVVHERAHVGVPTLNADVYAGIRRIIQM